MRILFDNGTPEPLIPYLAGHGVTTAIAAGWERLENGDLLSAAERAGFEVLLTTDKNIRYQQNLTGRKIALVILGNPQWPLVQLHLERIVSAVNACTAGSYIEVEIPFE